MVVFGETLPHGTVLDCSCQSCVWLRHCETSVCGLWGPGASGSEDGLSSPATSGTLPPAPQLALDDAAAAAEMRNGGAGPDVVDLDHSAWAASPDDALDNPMHPTYALAQSPPALLLPLPSLPPPELRFWPDNRGEIRSVSVHFRERAAFLKSWRRLLQHHDTAGFPPGRLSWEVPYCTLCSDILGLHARSQPWFWDLVMKEVGVELLHAVLGGFPRTQNTDTNDATPIHDGLGEPPLVANGTWWRMVRRMGTACLAVLCAPTAVLSPNCERGEHEKGSVPHSHNRRARLLVSELLGCPAHLEALAAAFHQHRDVAGHDRVVLGHGWCLVMNVAVAEGMEGHTPSSFIPSASSRARHASMAERMWGAVMGTEGARQWTRDPGGVMRLVCGSVLWASMWAGDTVATNAARNSGIPRPESPRRELCGVLWKMWWMSTHPAVITEGEVVVPDEAGPRQQRRVTSTGGRRRKEEPSLRKPRHRRVPGEASRHDVEETFTCASRAMLLLTLGSVWRVQHHQTPQPLCDAAVWDGTLAEVLRGIQVAGGHARRHHRVVTAALWALEGLAARVSHVARFEMISLNVLPTVYETMLRFQGDAFIHELCVGVLHAMSRTEDVCRAVARTGGLALATQCLRLHPGEPRLRELGRRLFQDFKAVARLDPWGIPLCEAIADTPRTLLELEQPTLPGYSTSPPPDNFSGGEPGEEDCA